jgi:flagellar protein FliO/FliZ
VILGILFCLSLNARAVEVAAADMSTDKTSDEALIQAAEKLVAEKVTPAAPAATPVTADTKESEIPIQLQSAPKSRDNSNILWRLAASLGFLGIVAGVLYYATRRWARPKDSKAKGSRIEMLHQFHMGPRRSIALIRVAGETMLVGVTDHNINMLKAVTLIDDELEGLMKKDFNNFLEDEFSIEDVRSALDARN